MTKILTLDEMREAISRFDESAAKLFAEQIKLIGDQMALMICTRYGLMTNERATTTETSELMGTACAFYLTHENATPPAELDDFDTGEPLETLEPLH